LVIFCRVVDALFQLLLTYFYLSLAFRENVLRVNGSNIQSWWIWHHYLSIFLTLTLTTWPETDTYVAFRAQFYIYAAYSGMVQIMQYRYQRQRLYVLTSLGQASVMDVANSDSAQIVVERSFAFLLPFIFLGHSMQLYNSFVLFSRARAAEWAIEWQAVTVGALFLVLALGNIQAMIVVIRNKWKPKSSSKKPKAN